MTRLSIINSRFVLHTSDFSSTISRFETGKTKTKRVFSTTGDKSAEMFPPKAACIFFAGLCCCTFVGFNQGFIFEAMPMLYMASRKAPKTNNFCRWFGEMVSMSKPTHPGFRKLWFFVQTCSKATTITYRREWFFVSKKGVGHRNVEHQEPKLCNNSAPRSKQSFTSAWAQKSNTILSHQPKLKYFPIDCAQQTCGIPLFMNPTSLCKSLNQIQLYVVWMATGWSHACGEKNCTGNPESPVFHHSLCYLMITISTLVSIHFCLDFQASKNWTPKKSPLYIASTSKVRGESP